MLAMYCIHVFVFAADRLGDITYDQRILKGIIGSTVATFGATTDVGLCTYLRRSSQRDSVPPSFQWEDYGQGSTGRWQLQLPQN